MKGALDFLLSESPHALSLRKQFVFKVIPMLNPDGVAVGNSRCNLAGADLNRSWIDPNVHFQREVHSQKKMMRRFFAEREVCRVPRKDVYV